MQGTEREDPAIRELEKLMDAAVPVVFANSSNFADDGMQFDGVYRFPGRDLDAVYPNVCPVCERPVAVASWCQEDV